MEPTYLEKEDLTNEKVPDNVTGRLFFKIVLAPASPVSATTDPGGETLSGSRSCPAGEQVKVISFANGARIEHKWSRLGGGEVYSERFVGGFGYELRETYTHQAAVFYTIYTYDFVSPPYPSRIEDDYTVCYPA